MVINHSLRWNTRLKICIFRTSMQMMNGSVPVFRVLLLFLFFYYARSFRINAVKSRTFDYLKTVLSGQKDVYVRREQMLFKVGATNVCRCSHTNNSWATDWLMMFSIWFLLSCHAAAMLRVQFLCIYIWRRVRREIFSKRSQAPVENMLNSHLTVVCEKRGAKHGTSSTDMDSETLGGIRKNAIGIFKHWWVFFS